MKLQIFGIHAECNVDNIMPNSQMKLRCDEQLNTNIYKHTLTLQKKGLSGRVFLGRVFKNAAQNGIKPRFLKTGLKGARPAAFYTRGLSPSDGLRLYLIFKKKIKLLLNTLQLN